MVPVNISLSNYIYVEFRKVFVSEASNSAFNLTAVTDHTLSYDLCYEAKDVTTTPMGPSVPTIDLVMHRPDAIWRITGRIQWLGLQGMMLTCGAWGL